MKIRDRIHEFDCNDLHWPVASAVATSRKRSPMHGASRLPAEASTAATGKTEVVNYSIG
jgi:hypothetical protein